MKNVQFAVAILIASTLIGCVDQASISTADGEQQPQSEHSGQGGGNGGQGQTAEGEDTGPPADTYIAYLRDNHDQYTESGLFGTPPSAQIGARALTWHIDAQTEAQADNLKNHIEAMGARIDAGLSPRPWDKFFIIEAALGGYIHTAVNVNSTRVLITKTADNDCAFEVMAKHAEIVSGEFFATGKLNTDHSSIADELIASEACAEFKTDLDNAVALRWEPKT